MQQGLRQIMAKYTFVIPVYNTEKYLEECIQSILKQTYSDFKVLLIDDGSTDGSWEICKKLAEQDKRVEVGQVENGGPARIRNIGIRNCQTEYVWFVDSDDRLAPEDILARIDEKLKAYQSDMMFFLSGEYNEDFSICKKRQSPYALDGDMDISGEELLVKLQTQENIVAVGTSPVNKIIKTKILQENNSYFVEHFRWHAEDEFLSKTIFYSHRFYFFNTEVYQVRVRPNSITTTVNTKILERKILTKFELVDICCRFFEDKSKTQQLKSTMFTYYSYYYLFGLQDYFRLCEKEQKRKVKKAALSQPFIFTAMKRSRSKNIRLLSKIFRFCGWNIALKFIKWRYSK